MPTKIGAVFIDLGLKSDAFDKGIIASEVKLKSLAATATSTAFSFSKNMVGSLASAAAGFLTLDAVVGKMNEALEQFGNIADKSRSAGLSAEFFQGISYAAQLSGVSIDQVSGALDTFAKNSGLAAEGKGKLVSQLQVLNPELLRTIQLATTQEERILAVANALATETDASKQAAIATATFGDAGTGLVAVLDQGAASLTKFIQRAKEAGIVVEENIIRRADEIGDKLDEANTILDTKLKVSALNFGNLSLWVKGLWVDLVDKMGYAVNRFDEINNRNYIQPLQGELATTYSQIDELTTKAADLRNEIEATGGQAGWQFALEDTETRIDRLKVKANELLSRIQVLQGYQPPAAPAAPSAPAAPVNPNMKAGLDMGLAADPILLAGVGGVAGGTNPVVTGLGQVDVALEASKKNMADWAVSFDAEINATGAAMEALAQKSEQAWSGTADMVGGFFSDMAGIVGSSTKETFELSKKLNLAGAIVSGINATMEAYKAGWATGPVTGPTLSLLWGGIAAATAAAKVAAIGATSFNSTSMGAGAGSAAGAGPGGAGAAPVGQTQGISISLAPGRYSASEVAGLIQDIGDYLGLQGKQLSISHINGA